MCGGTTADKSPSRAGRRGQCPYCSTPVSASNPGSGRMTEKTETPNGKKEWLWAFEDTASHVGLVHMCGHFQRRGMAERRPSSFWVSPAFTWWRRPPGVSLGFIEEKGKLNAWGTTMELPCLGPWLFLGVRQPKPVSRGRKWQSLEGLLCQ